MTREQTQELINDIRRKDALDAIDLAKSVLVLAMTNLARADLIDEDGSESGGFYANEIGKIIHVLTAEQRRVHLIERTLS